MIIMWLFGIFAFLGTGQVAVSAETLPPPSPGEMTFRWSRNGGNCNHCIWLSGEGRITEYTADRLTALISTPADGKGAELHLHSEGGSLLGGLRLGKTIRDYQLQTVVGRSVPANLGGSAPNDLEQIEGGVCASACAWAFLGGAVRTLHANSKLGFHQLYRVLDPHERLELALSTLEDALPLFSEDQLISGLLIEYLFSMDVDARVFQLSAEAGPQEMIYPDRATLSKLGVLTKSGLGEWDLEPYGHGLVAFSREQSPNALLHQVTLFCRKPGEVIIMGTSTPHHQRSQMFRSTQTDSSKWWPGFLLEIDGVEYRIASERIRERLSSAASHYAEAVLSDAETEALLKAEEFQFRYVTARFLGERATRGLFNQTTRATLSVTLRNCIG